jgi:hypothetical protein
MYVEVIGGPTEARRAQNLTSGNRQHCVQPAGPGEGLFRVAKGHIYLCFSLSEKPLDRCGLFLVQMGGYFDANMHLYRNRVIAGGGLLPERFQSSNVG